MILKTKKKKKENVSKWILNYLLTNFKMEISG